MNLTPTLELNLLKNEISGNYRQMMQARSKAGELALELTFEQRMNQGLESYKDLAVLIGRLGLDELDYDQA